MNLPHDADTLVPRHAEDETLLAYLDGELDPAAAAQTSSHLEQCWSCRSRMNGLESSIHEFLEARERLLPPDITPGSPADASFRRRLADHAAKVLPRPVLSVRLDAWRFQLTQAVAGLVPSPAVRYAFFGMATMAVIAFAVANWWNVPVSAEAIVARAEVRELFDIRCSKEVVRSVVNIDRLDDGAAAPIRLGVIETHTDPSSSALSVSIRTAGGGLQQAVLWGRDALENRQPVAGVLPDQLARFLTSRRWSPGVSIPGYLRLVAERGDAGVEAVRAGGLFEITHTFMAGHPSGVEQTRLFVDANRWLPVQISLFTRDAQGRHEFRFAREALEFLPRTPDLARLFASARPASDGRAGLRRREAGFSPRKDAPVPRRPLPLAWDSTPASDAEAAVAGVLHTLGADLGEEVNIFPMSDGSLLVQGLVDTDSRRQAIERALKQVPSSLQIEIHTPADLQNGSELFAPPWRAVTDVEVPATPASGATLRTIDTGGLRVPMQKRLEEYVGRTLRAEGTDASPSAVSRGVSSFSNDVVSRSRTALFHAWALYRLDQQFSPARTSALSLAALEQVTAVRQSHRSKLTRIAHELVGALGPLAALRDAALHQPGSEPDPPTLLRLVSDADGLVRELFTLSSADADPAPSLSRLAVLLHQVY
jgi:hypothetical protein